MEKFTTHTGIVAPLGRANVDTDAIIPKQFLRKIERTGFGVHLFHEWRYTDYDGTIENSDFILNKPEYRNSTILLTRDNFGCGSSREHAPWALADFGFKVIISSSFADIFYNNCIKNGILLIRLKPEEVDLLFQETESSIGVEFTADLEKQILTTSAGNEFSFEINDFAKHCLLNGLDQIGWTLEFEDKISAYEEKIKETQPWLA
ncbi:MAG: 3-isopropylmalate dehydratase small subunit [Candidatus Omnitrophica bacterium]|nr:3-isopropylmalate dehydratase small subunit [Candidatus Omnitrophota bacterium]